MYDLGSRLKEVRNKRGLTQRALAKRINKSIAAVSSYESNAQVPPTDVLVSIAQTLSVPITYLIDVNCDESYSVSGLTDAQKDFVCLLFKEFTSQPNDAKESLELSQQQIELVRKLLLLFSSK